VPEAQLLINPKRMEQCDLRTVNNHEYNTNSNTESIMFTKKSSLLIALLLFVGVGCSSPGSLTSEEITNVAGVVMSADYNRVANAELHFMADDLRTNTTSDGTFVLHEVSVGTQTVSISSESYGTVEKEVDIVNEGTRLEIKLD
jgi:hypothetical protein